MAYRFTPNDRVEFAIAPFNGYTFGPHTFAFYFKLSAHGGIYQLWYSMTSAAGDKVYTPLFSDTMKIFRNSTCQPATSLLVNNTSTWYLLVITGAGGSGLSRFHLHNGTSWAHVAGSGAAANVAYTGTDRMFISASFQGFPGDIVCAGIKKADSSDATVETLSRTSFQAWRDFGFDWLIGFDSSLEAAGVLQDQGSPGTGDEIAISGTSAVAAPAGWSWVGTPASTFVPQIIIT